MLQLLACALALVLLVPVSLAQQAPPDAPVKEPWHVPVGPGEHRVELGIEADQAGTYAVRIAEAPKWLVLEAATADLAKGMGTLVLPFQVAAEALSGAVEAVRLEVLRDGAVVAESAFRVELEAPAAFEVRAPYPNPSAGGTVQMVYLLPEAAAVSVEVFDVLGRRVLQVREENREAGSHVARLDVSRLAAGPYVLRLVSASESGADVHTARLTLVR